MGMSNIKLQDGKKIPKWNRQSRVGEFLGFSEEHSLLVANIRHLGTGYISPKYHCMFDDKFETVYSTGENDSVTAAITDMLWDTNKELYADDEFDNDGILVYQPPPLHDVSLMEEESREKKVKLQNQRERRRYREEKTLERIVDAVPARSWMSGT